MRNILCFHMGYATLSEVNYGSEISLIHLAKELEKYYDVYIFSSNCQKEEGDLKFKNSSSFEEFSKNNVIDIIIISRYLNIFLDNTLKANKIFVWVHDLTFQSFWNGHSLRDSGKHLYNNVAHRIDGVVVLSNYHKQLIMNMYSIPSEKVHVIYYGINDNTKVSEKTKYKFIYTSYPSRGLDFLLKMFPKIKQEFPESSLDIYRDIKTFSEEQLKEIEKYDYIHNMGYQPNEKINEAFQSASVWLYPTNFLETFCMSALEAQASGCLCITSSIGSLVEVVADRGVLIENNYGSNEYIENVIKTLRIFFNSDLYNNKIRKAKEWAKKNTWENIGNQWCKLLGTDIKQVPPIPSYVINLNKQPQKWEKCRMDLINNGFEMFERFQGIDGETLEWGQELQKYFVLHEDSYKYIPHKNNAGIFGCGMSHVRLWEKLAECEEEKVWMIMEDDVVPNKDFEKNWTKVYNSIKDDKSWDICYLGYTFFGEKILPTDKKIHDNVYQLVKSDKRQNCGGTFCYVITTTGAKKLLDLVRTYKIHRAIDWFIIDFYDKICAYICTPLLVHHNSEYQTMIQGVQKSIKGIK